MPNISYYDVTKTVNRKRHFVAKTSDISYARKIARMVSGESGVKEANIIAWYRLADGSKRFTIKESIHGNKKQKT
jgi:hypothetical protein